MKLEKKLLVSSPVHPKLNPLYAGYMQRDKQRRRLLKRLAAKRA